MYMSMCMCMHMFDSREIAALAELGLRELCPWRSTIDMKVMHAWHQQIESVAHAALASTAAAMARVVCHDPHHLYRGQAC